LSLLKTYLKIQFFRDGWRYVLAWICVLAVFGMVCVAPFVHLVGACLGYNIAWPTMDEKPTMELIILILGLRGANSFDRLKGISGADMEGKKEDESALENKAQ
jgi:hypothetical protein